MWKNHVVSGAAMVVAIVAVAVVMAAVIVAAAAAVVMAVVIVAAAVDAMAAADAMAAVVVMAAAAGIADKRTREIFNKKTGRALRLALCLFYFLREAPCVGYGINFVDSSQGRPNASATAP
jgi:hypothetical protein